MIPNPWVIIAVLVALAGAWLTGWEMRGDKADAEKLEAALAYAELVRNEQDRSAQIASDFERDMAQARTRARTREAQLRGELNNATYRTCMLPESGRMLYNAAIRDASRSTPSEPKQPVPAAGATAQPGNDGRPAADGDK